MRNQLSVPTVPTQTVATAYKRRAVPTVPTVLLGNVASAVPTVPTKNLGYVSFFATFSRSLLALSLPYRCLVGTGLAQTVRALPGFCSFAVPTQKKIVGTGLAQRIRVLWGFVPTVPTKIHKHYMRACARARAHVCTYIAIFSRDSRDRGRKPRQLGR